jgi:hypothetical protein
MPRSTKRGSASSGRKGSGGRLQTVGIFVTFLAVAALVGSLAWGVWEHFHTPKDTGGDGLASAARPGDVRPPAQRVRVQVLNATSTHGLARVATDVLRDRGFDVVEMGNARGFSPETSVVLDRVGNLDLARETADALGIHRVEARRDSNLVLDVTVVLGKDWKAPVSGQPTP